MVGNSFTIAKLLLVSAGVLVALAFNQVLLVEFEDQEYRQAQAWAVNYVAGDNTSPAAILLSPPPAPEPIPAPETEPAPIDPPPTRVKPAAILSVPAIALRVAVFDHGTSESALRKGPAFFPGRSNPSGRVAIAGHLGEAGGPFEYIGELRPGDLITLSIVGGGEYAYRVSGSHVVHELDWGLIDDTRPGLILQACLLGARYHAYRLLVEAAPY